MATLSPPGSPSRTSARGSLESSEASEPRATDVTDASLDADALLGQALIGPVLLAVDGSAECQPAIRLAHALAERRGASIHVITVGEPHLGPIPSRLTMTVTPADRARALAVERDHASDVGAFLCDTLAQHTSWPIAVASGSRSDGIVAEATRLGASLILLGLRCHHALGRALHDETTLNVMRAAPCPVLGVTERLFGLPRRILVGVDFSQASLTAARAAVSLVADDGELVLAYVASPRTPDLPDDGERLIHELGVGAAFNWFDGELGRLGGATVEHVILQHQPSRTVFDLIAEHAVATSVDAIALGSARHGRVERWLLGSVSTDAARDGRYSLLVVPPAGARTS